MQALLDLSFTKFVSPSIVKIVYVLIMVLLAIDYLTWVVLGFEVNAFVGVLVLIIVGPIFTIVSLALARMGLEVLIAMTPGGLPAAPGTAYTPPARGPQPQTPPTAQPS
jgi:hypothetical protein